MSILTLPAEIVEKVLHWIPGDDIVTRYSLSQVCPNFQEVIANQPVQVHIPLADEHIKWLKDEEVAIHSLTNKQIAKYVLDQISALDLRQLRTAKCVGYDYEQKINKTSGRFQVTQDYFKSIEHILDQARNSLERLELNVDLVRGRRFFRFTEILSQFSKLKHLTIHFSTQIEVNQRVLNNGEPQAFLDILVANLPKLESLTVVIYPAGELRLRSNNLKELRILKSDEVAYPHFDLPSLERLHIYNNIAGLCSRTSNPEYPNEDNPYYNDYWIVFDHPIAPIYRGCPRLQNINNIKLPAKLVGDNRLEERPWLQELSKIVLRESFLLSKIKDVQR